MKMLVIAYSDAVDEVMINLYHGFFIQRVLVSSHSPQTRSEKPCTIF